MAAWLRQGTAISLPFGPFLDSTNGDDKETGLTIAQADVRVRKNGGSYAQKHDSDSATHDENGNYSVPLDATDTDTLGPMRVSIHVAGALAVWCDFQVVPAPVYDAFIAGTDSLEVDAVAISGDAGAAGNLEKAFDGTGWGFANCTIPVVTSVTNGVTLANGAISEGKYDGSTAFPLKSADTSTTALARLGAWPTGSLSALSDAIAALNDPTAASIAGAVWDEARASHVGAGSFGETLGTVQSNIGYLDASVSAITSAVGDIKAVTDQLPNAGALSDLASIKTKTDFLPNAAAGNAGGLPTVDGSNRIAGIQGTTTTFDALKTYGDGAWVTSDLTAADVAAAVWDEVLAGHSDTGTAGKALSDAQSAGDPWTASLPGSYGAGTAGYLFGQIYDHAILITAGRMNTPSPQESRDDHRYLTAGDDYSTTTGKAFTVTKSSGAQWPVDLTNWSIQLVIQTAADDAVAFSIDGEVVTATGDNQSVRAALTAAQTATLTVGSRNYQWFMTATSGGEKNTLASGLLSIYEGHSAS